LPAAGRRARSPCPSPRPGASALGELAPATYLASMNGYRQSVGGSKVSLIERGLTQRRRLSFDPALSFVPLARAPPNGC